MAARIKDKPVICLPGFDVDNVVVLWSLVIRLKLSFGQGRRQGDADQRGRRLQGDMGHKLLVQHSSPAGIEEWLRVKTAKVGRYPLFLGVDPGASVLWAPCRGGSDIALLPASALECEKGTDVKAWMKRERRPGQKDTFPGFGRPRDTALVTPIRRRGGDLVSRAVEAWADWRLAEQRGVPSGGCPSA